MRLRAFLVVTLLAVLLAGVAPEVAAAPQSISITNLAADVTFEEADEYGTLVWNDPWDMSQALDIRQVDSAKGVFPNRFNAYTPCAAGLWCGQVRSDVSNPYLFLLHPGYAGALHLGRDGNARPIDTSKYARLTFRMYLNSVPGGALGWSVSWTNGTIANLCDANCGRTPWFPIYAGWNIYSINLPTSRVAGQTWSGSLTGLQLNSGGANMQDRLVFLDWARLSGPNGDDRQIQWTQSGESGNVSIQFRSSDGATSPYRAYTVSGGTALPETVPVGAGSYIFQGSLPPDDWRVVLQAGVSSDTSAGRWRIQAAPTLSFVKPGYTTGADYATTVKGNAWDMNEPQDVFELMNVQGPSFANGQLTAASLTTGNTTCVPGNCNPTWSDPELRFLNYFYWEPHDPDIDSSRFRYASFKLKVDGAPDISYGSVARLFWSSFVNTTDCGVTDDILLHSDWNIVNIDLWDNSILDDAEAVCTNGWRAVPAHHQFRLDPHEIPVATTFYVDYVLLTAMDAGSVNSDFPIKYVPNKPGVTVTFYYNTTRTTSGRRLANPHAAGSPSSGPFDIFLPMISRLGSAPTDPAGTQVFLWDLAGVTPNTYYLSAEVSDGRKTTTWFSDAAVVITP